VKFSRGNAELVGPSDSFEDNMAAAIALLTIAALIGVYAVTIWIDAPPS